MSGRRRMMMVMPEDCLTFDIIAEEGQTLSVTPKFSGTFMSIDLGDGVIQTIPFNGSITHTYPAGDWKVRIYGTDCGGCHFRGTVNIVRSNERWHYLGERFTNGSEMFRGMANSRFDFKTLPPQITNGSIMFYNCANAILPLTKLPGGLTTCNNMFHGCTNALLPLTEIPDGVTSLTAAFVNCSSALLPIKRLPLNVISGHNAFAGCFAAEMEISELPDSLTNCQAMFQRCGGVFSVKKLPSSATDLSYLFNDYDYRGSHPMVLDDFVANAPAGGYPAVTTINYMFYYCRDVVGSRSAFLALFPNATSTNAFNGTNTTE